MPTIARNRACSLSYSVSRLAREGVPGADRAALYIQAYSLTQHDQFNAAATLLQRLGSTEGSSDADRYRVVMLRAAVLRHLGRHDEAMRWAEEALDVAIVMQDDTRALRAMLGLARMFISIGNADRAGAHLAAAQELASRLGDEPALEDIYRKRSELADNWGDRAAERQASLQALAHARKSGSRKVLMFALLNIADSYLKNGEFAASLDCSRQALAIARTLRSAAVEQTLRFNQGMAYIGLNRIEEGNRLAAAAMAEEMASGDLVDAQGTLLEYAQSLERIGDWQAALRIYHRYVEVREKIMSAQRQQELLQLSAKFDAERQARQIDLLKRDNSLHDADMAAEMLKRRMIIAGSVLVTLICVALAWAFTIVKRANERLWIASERRADGAAPGRDWPRLSIVR